MVTWNLIWIVLDFCFLVNCCMKIREYVFDSGTIINYWFQLIPRMNNNSGDDFINFSTYLWRNLLQQFAILSLLFSIMTQRKLCVEPLWTCGLSSDCCPAIAILQPSMTYRIIQLHLFVIMILHQTSNNLVSIICEYLQWNHWYPKQYTLNPSSLMVLDL